MNIIDTNRKDSDTENTKKPRKTQDSEFGLVKRELLRNLKLKHSERKLIVSSIPLDSSELEIFTLFNTALQALYPGLPPLSTVSLSEDKTHAVLEFKSKEHVRNCLLLDGIEFRGRRLRIMKHKAYLSYRVTEMKREIRDKERREKETEDIMNCNIFPNHDNRVFMGNLPTNLSEEDVRQMVESFGKLKSFSLVKNSAVGGQSRGFCFFEFWDPRITDKAIEQLNQLEIGDRRIKVQRATQGQNNNTLALTAGKNKQKKKFSEGLFKNGPSGILLGLTPLQLQQIQAVLAVPIHAIVPSKCITMLNLVDPQDLVDDSDYQDIYNDI